MDRRTVDASGLRPLINFCVIIDFKCLMKEQIRDMQLQTAWPALKIRPPAEEQAGVFRQLRSVFKTLSGPAYQDLFSKLVQTFFTTRRRTHKGTEQTIQAFYRHVHKMRNLWQDHYPFIGDALRLEMGKYCLDNQPSDITVEFTFIGDPLRDVPLLNPVHRFLKLTYPVHWADRQAQLQRLPGEYFVLLFKNQMTLNLDLMELDRTGKMVFDELRKSRWSGQQILLKVNQRLALNENDLIEQGRQFLRMLLDRGMILGFKTDADGNGL